jgi:hypothetical protein
MRLAAFDMVGWRWAGYTLTFRVSQCTRAEWLCTTQVRVATEDAARMIMGQLTASGNARLHEPPF